MKIHPYIPTYCDFPDLEIKPLEVNSCDELMRSELAKDIFKDGGTLCFSLEPCQSYLMAMFEQTGLNYSGKGCTWTIISLIHDSETAKTLAEWLPSFQDLKKGYEQRQKFFELYRHAHRPQREVNHEQQLIAEIEATKNEDGLYAFRDDYPEEFFYPVARMGRKVSRMYCFAGWPEDADDYYQVDFEPKVEIVHGHEMNLYDITFIKTSKTGICTKDHNFDLFLKKK